MMELIKTIFILHYFYMEPKYYGEDVDDGYGVYGFDVGSFHPTKTTKDYGTFDDNPWDNTDPRCNELILDINKAISKITDTNIDLKLGMLFNHDIDRIAYDGDTPLPSTVPQTTQTVAFASLYSFIKGITLNPLNHIKGHPYV